MNTKDPIKDLFDLIIDRHSGLIRRTCRVYATPSISEDDLYQEVMLVIWRGLKSFRGEAALTTWLYRTTINTCISYLRSMVRHTRTVSIETGEAQDIENDVPTYGTDDVDRLHQLINGLNPIDKAIVSLWLDEESYERIAEVTGLSHSNVATRLNRIRKRLKKEF
ncbi:MAG: sigma-70 family RNA polymerase sigma factor [Muribaculaceae bacterium]|nr:sigma-70 family RNA polymerase sigma factor [Muribaculaceae bacterium]